MTARIAPEKTSSAPPPPIVIDIRSTSSHEDLQTRKNGWSGDPIGDRIGDPIGDPIGDRIGDRMGDPRSPPEIDPRREINIPTRGLPPRYEQIGYLSSDKHADVQVNNIIPLFGRRTYSGSGNWNYYTKTQAGVKIPLSMDGRDCSDDIPGCRELYDEDTVEVPALDGEYTVSLYNIGAPRYIPYV